MSNVRPQVGKKPDTFSLGWGLNQPDLQSQTGQNGRQHPNRKQDQFSVGWGQQFEPEKPRNAFNPHQQDDKIQPNYKRQNSQG